LIEEQQDYQGASSAYLVWPLALAALLREDPAASRWTRIHTRQALAFGLTASLGFVVLLALPLMVVIADAGISTGATVGVYTAGLLLDAIAFVVLTVFAFSYAARAARGELFKIPLVSTIADRIFTIRR
jgi:uncharacterized Tic20 family protein